jgi:hypothetical protein
MELQRGKKDEVQVFKRHEKQLFELDKKKRK